MDGVHLLRGRAAELAFSPFPPSLIPTVTGFYTLNLATWEVQCDDQTYTMHGLDPGAVPRLETFLERVPPNDMPDLLAAISNLSQACGDYRIEYRIVHRDGSLRSMEARGRVLAGENGLPQRMIGIALDTSEYRAQRDAEHEFATRLQHQMLPNVLAGVPGIATAARYLPATAGMLIGGDWYDAVPRPDGSLALVIGDVQGHSVQAACVMGQLRTALHAFLSEGHRLDEALTMTNRMLTAEAAGIGDDLFASCCVVSLSPSGGELQACRAGHPPPAVATPEGGVRLLDLPAGLLLGVEPDTRYELQTVPMPTGSTVFLCTDGLLETGCGDLKVGLERVIPVLAAGAGQDLDVLADELIETAQPVSARHDDIAVLVARALGCPC
jgi:hypothetical protein